MADVYVDDVYGDLIHALEENANAAAVRELLVALRQETRDEQQQAQRVLSLALDRDDKDVLQVVIDAMPLEMIRPADVKRPGALHTALIKGRKEAVMAVVERLKREAVREMGTWSVEGLLRSKLIADQEVVDAVLDVLPPDAFSTGDQLYAYFDCAFTSRKENLERAVTFCLQHGPPMEQLLQGRHRFCYVFLAGALCDVKTVKRMHDLVPLLADGSGRRGDEADYVGAMYKASENWRLKSVWPIMEYLLEQADTDILDLCDCSILLNVRTKDDAEWLVTRAPHLLEEACAKDDFLTPLLRCSDGSNYIQEEMVQYVDKTALRRLMYDLRIAPFPFIKRSDYGWRWRLEVLHKKVPGCMRGRVTWSWLMDAIHDKMYRDVEYMVGMCTREHLVKRNFMDETAYDVAANERAFPPKLLLRLKVEAKGAHA